MRRPLEAFRCYWQWESLLMQLRGDQTVLNLMVTDNVLFFILASFASYSTDIDQVDMYPLEKLDGGHSTL